MQTVQQIAEGIVAREGGYVNDPDDPGGATNHGITLATLQRHGHDLTGDGRITSGDVKVLSRSDAVDILIAHYFRAPSIGDLPDMLQPSVFDMYVNAGGMAVKLLQRLLIQLGYPLAVDGAVGPATIRAAHAAACDIPARLADAYGVARRDYYYRLGDGRPASRKYARRRDGGKGGWITRAEEFISPPFHLTDAQHRQRTAPWD